MDHKIIHGLLNATEQAAVACHAWIGKGDGKAADGAAVNAMRAAMNSIDFEGTIVIGEGERDEAPMLYIGEKVGKGGEKVDIAVDPLEGTNLAAADDHNSISVLVVSPKGTLLNAPDTYMEKIAIGPAVGRRVSLKKTVQANLDEVADALEKPLNEIKVVMLERDRHKEMIETIRKLGCKIKLIRDGDVYGAVSTCLGGADILLGTGAAPEGVLAASAVKSLGGYMEGRLKIRDEGERKRALEYGIRDTEKIMSMDDMVKGDESVFIATGVTEGSLVSGVRKRKDSMEVSSVIIQKGSTKYIRNVVKTE